MTLIRVSVRLPKTFRDKGIPCDVIRMDIDYMDGFRCFTFEQTCFDPLPNHPSCNTSTRACCLLLILKLCKSGGTLETRNRLLEEQKAFCEAALNFAKIVFSFQSEVSQVLIRSVQANKSLVAASHKRNELVSLRHDTYGGWELVSWLGRGDALMRPDKGDDAAVKAEMRDFELDLSFKFGN